MASHHRITRIAPFTSTAISFAPAGTGEDVCFPPGQRTKSSVGAAGAASTDRIEWVNQAFVNITGFTREEVARHLDAVP